MREHDRLGRAVAGRGEQLERPAAVGLRPATRAATWGHESSGGGGGAFGRRSQDIRRPQAIRAGEGLTTRVGPLSFFGDPMVTRAIPAIFV